MSAEGNTEDSGIKMAVPPEVGGRHKDNLLLVLKSSVNASGLTT